jgi:hypothetical protein
MQRFSMSLVIREMKIKPMRSYYFTLKVLEAKRKIRITVGKDVKKLRSPYIADSNVKWCTCL